MSTAGELARFATGTSVDVLGYLDRVPICTGYDIDGSLATDFPTTRVRERAAPIYDYVPGWRTAFGDVERFTDLPEPARAYVQCLEALIEVPIRWVSFGPHREQLLER